MSLSTETKRGEVRLSRSSVKKTPSYTAVSGTPTKGLVPEETRQRMQIIEVSDDDFFK